MSYRSPALITDITLVASEEMSRVITADQVNWSFQCFSAIKVVIFLQRAFVCTIASQRVKSGLHFDEAERSRT